MDLIIKIWPWFMSALSMFGCWLNIKKKASCWLVWEGTAVGFSVYFIFVLRDWGSAMIWLFYIFFDLYGWREWKRDEKIL
jgi:hypothetical protein